MIIKTEKGWKCPNCKKNKTVYTVERWDPKAEGEPTARVMHFACNSCHKHWGMISNRYQDVDDKDLVLTFKGVWEHAVKETHRGNYKLLDDMEFTPGQKRKEAKENDSEEEATEVAVGA